MTWPQAVDDWAPAFTLVGLTWAGAWVIVRVLTGDRRPTGDENDDG